MNKVTDFIQDVELSLTTLNQFDAVKFDQKLKRSDLASEKLMLASLKEDMYAAIENVITIFSTAVTNCDDAITAADALTSNPDKVAALLNAGKLLLGDDALLIPQFTLDDISGNEMENAYQAGVNEETLQFAITTDNRLLPVEDWLCGVARVKQKVHDWEHISILAQAFNPAADINLVPLQFPYQSNDRWLAMKFRDENNPADTLC
jgi:hypothetical protein